jgi:hypothetical protein
LVFKEVAQRAWGALIPILFLGCGAPKAPPVAPSTVLAFEKDPRLLIEEVELIRGVPDRRPTRIIFDDEQAFSRALEVKVKADAIGPTDADSQAFALAFEFPPPGATAGASWNEVYDEQILGFYDEHTHAIHVRRSALGEKSDLEIASVLAHEMTHSLQTQHFPFPNLAEEDNEDVRLAQNSVLEGDAMLVMVAYLARKNRIPLTRALVRAAQATSEREFERYSRARGGQEVLDRAPPLIRERLSFPYLTGLSFVGALYRAGGFELVNRVYQKPPATTEQVLHPEKYLAGEAAVPVQEPKLPADFQRVAGGRVGELQIRTILGYCLPPQRAAAAAAGWGGDAYVVATKANETGSLFWATAWDDEEQAKEFEAALKDYVQCTRARSGTHVMPLDDFVQRKGTRVALVRGLERRESNPALIATLGAVGAPARMDPPFGRIEIPPVRKAAAYRLPYVSAGHYVNEQLGLVSRIPSAFSVDSSKPLSVTLSRGDPSPVALGVEVSDQIPSMETIDELQGAMAKGFQGVLGTTELAYVGGRDVFLGELGRGLERTWRVAQTNAGLKVIVVPICASTGSVILWGVWADPNGASALDWWLGSLRSTRRGEPPICVELNP